jgi:hypothetical protein
MVSRYAHEERLHEYFQEKNLARAIREGTRPRDYTENMGNVFPDGAQVAAGIRRFNENTRNRALLLAASKRLRRIYFWGSTFCLFVLSPLLYFAASQLVSHGDSLWGLVPLFFGVIVVPLCALRGYFIWVRSHWYRWIGKGIKEGYEEGELL